jgi:hypothetical protein
MGENHQDFFLLIKKVEDAETNNFCELASLLGRNPKTDFAGSDLSHADLSGCDLSHANLSNANLRSCNLSHATLRYSNLSGSDLANANLQGADLAHADVTNCNLTNANLNSVDLSLVDLSVTRPEESHHEEFDLETKEPQKPSDNPYEHSVVIFDGEGDKRVEPGAKRRTRERLLGIEVLKYVKKITVPIARRKYSRWSTVKYVKAFIAKNRLPPPCVIIIGDHPYARRRKVIRFFWGSEGLVSYHYAVEDFLRFPCLRCIYNARKDLINLGVDEQMQENEGKQVGNQLELK